MNLTSPQFTQTDVLEITGLDAATLQTWANRKIVIPASEHAGRELGRGGRRLYSGEDIVWIAILKRITELGVPVGVASIACGFSTVRDRLRRHGRMPFALVWLRLNEGGTFKDPESTDTREKFTEYIIRACDEKNELPCLVIPTDAIARVAISRIEAKIDATTDETISQ